MRILVTGGSGFVGSHLVERLRSRGHDVVSVDIIPPRAQNNALFLLGDICEKKTERRIADVGPEIIVHAAGVSRVKDCIRDPVRALQVNVLGTLRLLEVARTIPGLKRFCYLSSEQAYGRSAAASIKEHAPLNPYNFYGWTKASADALVRQYSASVPVTVLRSAMGYGPRSPPSQVITKFFLRTMSGQPLLFEAKVQMDPSLSPTRDCNFISNAVDGFVLAIEKSDLESGEVFNIGSGKDISILELAGIICRIAGGKIEFSEKYEERPNEARTRLCLDISKARSILGYQPRVGLEEGLGLTYEWLKENRGYFGAASFVPPSSSESDRQASGMISNHLLPMSRLRSVSQAPR